MVEDKSFYDEQITAVVEGFTHVWNKFEATLSKELAQIKYPIDSKQGKIENHANANYGLLYRVSSIIHKKNNPTMGELSSALSVPLSTSTRIVDWLVENNYAQRLPDDVDRRVVRVALTDTGNKLYQATETYIRQRVQEILSCLTEDERAKLLVLTTKVVATLRDMTR